MSENTKLVVKREGNVVIHRKMSSRLRIVWGKGGAVVIY